MTVRKSLLLHPDSRCAALDAIDVRIDRTGNALSLDYEIAGSIRDLALPPPGPQRRADELWKHSCFEAFLHGREPAPYYELNFAPSRAWAAYRLESYRNGRADAAPLDPPTVASTPDAGTFRLSAVLDLGGLVELADAPWRLGISAVIEETDGNRSYWALAHPPGKPDFHHEHCFALQLPPA